MKTFQLFPQLVNYQNGLNLQKRPLLNLLGRTRLIFPVTVTILVTLCYSSGYSSMHARPFYATYECLVLTLYMDSSISNIVTLLLDAC